MRSNTVHTYRSDPILYSLPLLYSTLWHKHSRKINANCDAADDESNDECSVPVVSDLVQILPVEVFA